MKPRSSSFRSATWLALLAILLQLLATDLSAVFQARRLAGAGVPGVIEICTPAGIRLVRLDGGELPSAPAGPTAPACPFCLLASSPPPLTPPPPAVLMVRAAAVLRLQTPPPVAPRDAGAAYRLPASRAPPLHA